MLGKLEQKLEDERREHKLNAMSNMMDDPMDEELKALLNDVANEEWQSLKTAPNDTKNTVVNYKNKITKSDKNKNTTTKMESLVLRGSWINRAALREKSKTTHKSPEVIVEIPMTEINGL